MNWDLITFYFILFVVASVLPLRAATTTGGWRGGAGERREVGVEKTSNILANIKQYFVPPVPSVPPPIVRSLMEEGQVYMKPSFALIPQQHEQDWNYVPLHSDERSLHKEDNQANALSLVSLVSPVRTTNGDLSVPQNIEERKHYEFSPTANSTMNHQGQASGSNEELKSLLFANRFPQMFVEKVCSIADNIEDLLAADDEDIEIMLGNWDEIKKLTLLRFMKWIHEERSVKLKKNAIEKDLNTQKKSESADGVALRPSISHDISSGHQFEAQPVCIEIITRNSSAKEEIYETSSITDDLHEYMMDRNIVKLSVHDLDDFRAQYQRKRVRIGSGSGSGSGSGIVSCVRQDKRFKVVPQRKNSGFDFICCAVEKNQERQEVKKTIHVTGANKKRPNSEISQECSDLYAYMCKHRLWILYARKLQQFKREYPQHANKSGIIYNLRKDKRFLIEHFPESPNGPKDYIIRRVPSSMSLQHQSSQEDQANEEEPVIKRRRTS